MTTRIQTEELAVDHVCDPRERVPVRGVKRGERPTKSREGNSAIHHRIFFDVRIVIESDELMADHLRINTKRDCCETN